MPATILHALSMTTPVDPAYENQPKHWNSAHAVTLNVLATEISPLFSNKNGVSFGIDGTNITGSIAAGVPSPVNFSAGTTSSDLGSVVFSNSNGLAFGLNGSTITGSYTVPTQTAFVLSDSNGLAWGTNASTVTGSYSQSTHAHSSLSFSNANGVTFGTNASTLTASVQTNYAGVGETVGTTAGTDLALTVNTDGISIGYPKWITTGRASTDAIGLNTAQSNVTWTVNSSGLSLDARGYAGTGTTFAGANVSGSITQNSAGLNLSLSAGAGGGVVLYDGANSITSGTARFTNANGVSFTFNGQTISGSVAATSSIVGTNGISISTNGSTISVLPLWISSYENMNIGSGQTMTLAGASISHAVAFNLPWAVSASFLRLPVLMTTNSTTLATTATANANASIGIFSTWNAVVYSLGAGASSQSLRSVASGSAGFTWQQSISVTNSTQYSITQAYSGQALGAGTTRTTQYSVSNSNYSFTTNQIATEWSSARFLDIPFANSLSPGPYWLVFGMSTTSSTGGNASFSNMSNCNVRYSNHYGGAQPDIAFGIMGSTNLSSGGLFGAGSFSTAGGGTTNSLPISAISSSANNARPYFQLLRSA